MTKDCKVTFTDKGEVLVKLKGLWTARDLDIAFYAVKKAAREALVNERIKGKEDERGS